MPTEQLVDVADLPTLLERQQGVLGRAQALAAGLSADAWRWRLTSGRWQRLLPGVAACHSGGVGEEELRWAAVLYGGRAAALTGDCALRAWGVRIDAPEVVRIAVPVSRVVAPQLGLTHGSHLQVQPHRVLRLAELVHPARAPLLLRPAPAALHAAAWAPSARAAEWRVAATVQQRIVTVPQLREALRALPGIPRRALVAEVLDDVELGAHARSELDLLDFLRRHGLPLPDRLQLPVRAGSRLRYLDAWWERQRVALEMDGAHHRLVGAWEADLLRAGELAVATRAERVLQLRLTPGQLRHDELAVVRLLRGALR